MQVLLPPPFLELSPGRYFLPLILLRCISSLLGGETTFVTIEKSSRTSFPLLPSNIPEAHQTNTGAVPWLPRPDHTLAVSFQCGMTQQKAFKPFVSWFSFDQPSTICFYFTIWNLTRYVITQVYFFKPSFVCYWLLNFLCIESIMFLQVKKNPLKTIALMQFRVMAHKVIYHLFKTITWKLN